MSGMEVVAVIGCVAAVVSAYKDGGRIVKSIKAKRAAKAAPAPVQPLEVSLERGPLAVGEARDSGIERYGPKFAKGDQVATEALRDILIHLQGTLLRHLWAAQEDDNLTDFNIVVDASDFGRIKSVTVLNELYMRMAQAAPLQRTLGLAQPGRVETLASISENSLAGSYGEAVATDAPVQSQRQFPPDIPHDQRHHDIDFSPDLQDREQPSNSTTPKKKWGLFSKSRKGSADVEIKSPPPRSDTDGSIEATLASDRPPNYSPLGIEFGGQGYPMAKTSSQGVEQPRLHSHGQLTNNSKSTGTWQPSPQLVIDEDNPWQSEVSSSSASAPQACKDPRPGFIKPPLRYSLPRRRSTDMTLVNDFEQPSQIVETHKNNVLLPTVATSKTDPDATSLLNSESVDQGSRGPQWKMPFMPKRRKTSEAVNQQEKLTPPQRYDTTPGSSPRASPTMPITRAQSSPQPATPGAKNPYGGFCKGAYKLQVGLEKESVNLRNQSTSMTGQSNYWACASSKCAFEGPALSQGKMWTFDHSVRSANAIQYRWTFLAKSHVAIKRVKKAQYDYQCVFCEEQPPPVHHSETTFIEHVATHRGQHPLILQSDKVRCISGRVALEDEEFDVNLTPRENTPKVQDQVFVSTPDDSPVQIKTPEKEGAFQWPPIERMSGTSHWRNNSDASQTLQALRSSTVYQDKLYDKPLPKAIPETP